MIFAEEPFQVRGWRFAASFETFWRLRASVRDRRLLLGLEPFFVRYILFAQWENVLCDLLGFNFHGDLCEISRRAQ